MSGLVPKLAQVFTSFDRLRMRQRELRTLFPDAVGAAVKPNGGFAITDSDRYLTHKLAAAGPEGATAVAALDVDPDL